MNNQTLEALTKYCLAKPGTTASYPFGEGALVFKVLDKMFALIGEDTDPLRMNLKCDPEDAQALRTQYEAIIPGYHQNKQHWNSLLMDGSLPDTLVHELIDHSYSLVVAKLSASKQKKLRALGK
ncbi:MAG TPA: MmcQ/YjbR family DNA-binding protein [Anaerolineales bacterium]|nr:MmcQ/YjbR family DNA-binding protein [Anaerolineales bacterium]